MMISKIDIDSIEPLRYDPPKKWLAKLLQSYRNKYSTPDQQSDDCFCNNGKIEKYVQEFWPWFDQQEKES